MGNDLLRVSLDQLRSKLDIIDAEMAWGRTPAEALQAIEQAVSAVRRDLWALLGARHADNAQKYTDRIRVRRATEMCEDVLADLHAQTLPHSTPGFAVFEATLRELAKAWSEARHLQLEGVR